MAKTIFNSSEKSNFILNLTKEKYSKMASITLVLGCIMMSVFTIFYELNPNEIRNTVVSGALVISGVFALIVAMIALVKKYITKQHLIPICAFAFMLIWAVVSAINSFNTDGINTSLYGFTGRGEGILAIIFYLCFFIVGLTISDEKSLTKVFHAIIAMGVLNAIWGLLQIFIQSFNSNYRYIISGAKDIRAASGLAQSPLFLALLLSLALTVAIIGGICFENKKVRIIYTISGFIFAFVMMFTYSLTALVGIALAIISGIIVVLYRKESKLSFLKIGGVVISSVFAVILVSIGAIGTNTNYRLHDGYLMWEDSYKRIQTSGGLDLNMINANDTLDVYSYLNSETIDIIKKYPLVGTGPEKLVYPQLYSSELVYANSGTFDKNYNEYLYVSATRGLPSLVAFLVILISVVYLGFRNIKKNKSSISICIAFFVTICCIILFFINNSNITFSPIFWSIAGILCCNFVEPTKTKSRKK